MKDTDKVTLSLRQIKKLVKEAKQKRLVKESAGTWKVMVYRASRNPSKEENLAAKSKISSLDDLKRIAKKYGTDHMEIIFDPYVSDVESFDAEIVLDWN